ncbi:MAG: dihydropteroate synthase [Lentisphaerae bacterium]|nr:dihydropteroate synthase [Lentisphaerota bacterium]
MGILNVTPDSFSDGGKYLNRTAAVSHAIRMVEDGADIIDVGGESTRPGATSADIDEEIERTIPVIAEIRPRIKVAISIDTMKSSVARAAIEAGADIVNDVSACTNDPEMADVISETGSGVVLMHMQGTPGTMQNNPQYDDVVSDVAAYLHARVEALVRRGIARESMVVDPGIGFGKTVEHNLRLLTHLDQFGKDGLPVLVGLSRKSFLGKITGRMVNERVTAGIAAMVFCIMNGVDIVRVHDVKETVDAISVIGALKKAQED